MVVGGTEVRHQEGLCSRVRRVGSEIIKKGKEAVESSFGDHPHPPKTREVTQQTLTQYFLN